MDILLDKIESYTVSSVLNKDVKQFGKQHMFDNKDETCWNSDQGMPQWVNIKFKNEQTIKSFTIQFQGGFAGKSSIFRGELATGGYVEVPFYPEDNNSLQKVLLNTPLTVKAIRFMFFSSTDFYGRIVIYRIFWD